MESTAGILAIVLLLAGLYVTFVPTVISGNAGTGTLRGAAFVLALAAAISTGIGVAYPLAGLPFVVLGGFYWLGALACGISVWFWNQLNTRAAAMAETLEKHADMRSRELTDRLLYPDNKP